MYDKIHYNKNNNNKKRKKWNDIENPEWMHTYKTNWGKESFSVKDA